MAASFWAPPAIADLETSRAVARKQSAATVRVADLERAEEYLTEDRSLVSAFAEAGNQRGATILARLGFDTATPGDAATTR
jgi:hypothetical protein